MRKTLSWLRTGRRPLWAAAVIVMLIILAVVINPIVGYATAQPQNATLVAALIALVGILAAQIVNTILARAGQRNQQVLEEQRAQAASLQSYLAQMGDLLLNHQLLHRSDLSNEIDNLRVVGWSGTLLVGRRIHNANPESENSRAVAHAQTLAVLEGLDSTRKRHLLQFLYYSALIKKINEDKPTISLTEADLSRADLSGANLIGADLSGANLMGADLSGAQGPSNLSGADLGGADLSGANLILADLSGAALMGADLSRAQLSGANLREASLMGAFLMGAYLSGADLRGAYLVGADLSPDADDIVTDLSRADLSEADLSGADLSGANLSGANVTMEQLAECKSLEGATLEGATLRDGSKHD